MLRMLAGGQRPCGRLDVLDGRRCRWPSSSGGRAGGRRPDAGGPPACRRPDRPLRPDAACARQSPRCRAGAARHAGRRRRPARPARHRRPRLPPAADERLRSCGGHQPSAAAAVHRLRRRLRRLAAERGRCCWARACASAWARSWAHAAEKFFDFVFHGQSVHFSRAGPA